MRSMEEVYEEKRRFIRKLEEALLCLDEIRGLDYRASDEMYIEELIRIDFHGEGDPHDYINVRGNSSREILSEVISLILEGRAVGLVRNPGRGDELWEELGTEMDREELTEV